MYSISSTLQHLVTDAFSTLSVNILTYLLIHWIVKTDYTQSLIRSSLVTGLSNLWQMAGRNYFFLKLAGQYKNNTRRRRGPSTKCRSKNSKPGIGILGSRATGNSHSEVKNNPRHRMKFPKIPSFHGVFQGAPKHCRNAAF